MRLCRIAGLIVLQALVLGACRQASEQHLTVPLLEAQSRPDILTEATLLDPPPSLGGNRFVSGWWPWKKDGQPVLVTAKSTVRLEGVQLLNRERQLLLDGEVLKGRPGDPVAVLIAGNQMEDVPLEFPLAIPIPAATGRGRFPVDLTLPQDAQIVVRNAAFRQAADSGSAAIEGASLRQSGPSLVDFVLPVPAGSRLVGSFSPPESTDPDQRFELWLEEEGASPRLAYSWSPGVWNRFLGRSSYDVPVTDEDGMVRIRFAATGEGGTGSWVRPELQLPIAGDEPTPAKQPAPAPAPPRLIVVYVMDALRADAIGHLGGPERNSPFIDRLAEAGTTQLDHYSVAPNTFPSIKAIFTGHTYRYDGGWKLPQEGPPTLAEAFQAGGYRTGLFSGNGLASPLYGTDRGFEHLAEDVVMRGLGPNGYSDNAEVVQAAALDWISRLREEERAFVYLQTLHPHNPYTPPPDLLRRFTDGIDSTIDGSTATLRNIKQRRLEPTAADVRRLRALYDASVAYNDEQIRIFLAELRKRYAEGEILFVITSDHGDELLEHGGVLHGYTLFEEQIHVPLILSWPGTLTPCRLDAPSDHLDLHYTLRSLVGAENPESWPGRSLWPELLSCKGRTSPWHVRYAAASSVQGGVFLARWQNLKWIWAPRVGRRWGQGEGAGRSYDGEYVFDLAHDPAEHHNLAGVDSLPAAWLRAQLLAWLDRDPTTNEQQVTPEIDSAERERLKALGYLN